MITADNVWQVTVNTAGPNQGNDVFTPKAGNIFVQINVTMKNISNETQTASSLLMWELKGPDGQKYNIALSNDTSPDGKTEAGGLLKGTLTYEVPTGTKKLTLNFITSLTDDSIDIWDINV